MRVRSVLGLICSFALVTAPLPSALIATVHADGDGPTTGTVETDRGLHTANFDTLYGTVTVNLPDDLSAGDSISGTVETKPAGKKNEDVARNQDELNGVVIEIADNKTPAKSETTHVKVPDNAPATIPVVIKDKGGREIARASIPVKPKPPALGCLQPADARTPASPMPMNPKVAEGPGPAESSGPNTIHGSLTRAAFPTGPAPCPVELPTFTQPGRTMEIKGPFDGNSGTTAVNVGGQATKVLAESPRKAVIKTPPNFTGTMAIEVFKKGQLLATAPVRSVGVKLWAGKLNLIKGETTKFTATVDGLDGLDVPVSLHIDNKSPAVVSMEGGNLQTFSVAPGQETKGQFVIGRVLTGIQPGAFAIVAVVDAKSRSIPSGGQERPQAGLPPNPNRPPDRPNTSQRAGQQPGPAGSPSSLQLPDHLPGPRPANIPPPACTGAFDDFESGVLAWDASGTFLQNQPVTGDVNIADVRPPGFRPESLGAIGGDYWDTPFPNGHQGQHWIWSRLAGEAATGEMISPEFTVATRYVHFLVAGGTDPGVSASLQIKSLLEPVLAGAAVYAGEPTLQQPPLPGSQLPRDRSAPGTTAPSPSDTGWHTLNTARGQGTDMMRRVVFEIPSQYMGRRARFKVEDRSATSHIAVDDFQCSNERPPIEPPPVWGIADPHLHQFTNVGFGGQFIRGYTFDHTASRPCDSANPADLTETADCAMAKALKRCDLNPNGDGIGHGAGGTMDFLGEHYHGTMGYPKFDGWPKWSSLDHQRVYVDWLRRAHDAGLQLIVIQLTSNEPICQTAAHNDLTCRDMPNVDHEIDQARAFEQYVTAHQGGWYKIVTTPADAREAIARGQLAAVLGIETDTLFDCPSLDSGDGIHPNMGFEPNQAVPALGLPARGACTPEQVTGRLNHYVNDLGVRYIFPIHLIDNQFGGAAVYNEFFQVANLHVNGSYFHLEPDATSPRSPTSPTSPTTACAPDVAYSMRMRNIPWDAATGIYLFGSYSFNTDSTPAGPHCSSVGLTPLGEHLLQEMMRLHVFIDVDHMSEHAFWSTVDITSHAPGGPYPLLSGHAGFRELGFSVDEAVAQRNDRGDAAGMVRHESMKSPNMIDAIWHSGGFVGPIIEPGNSKRSPSPSNGVVNDCPGSSKSWAQNYLYAADKMHGRGVGWGSEMNGVTKLPTPRFGGDDACKAVDQSDTGLLGLGPYQTLSRQQLADRQTTRVNYRAPQIARCDDSGFGRDRLGFIQQGMCKARTVTGSSWGEINDQCLADVSPCLATESGLHACLRNNVCRGVRRGMDPAINCDDGVYEIGAGSRNRTGACRAQQGRPCNTGNDDVDSVCREVTAELGSERQPTALQPVVAGTKVFNINTDGFAHVGMVPDFLADLETVGVTKPQFEPLFRSAEDFIEAWEKIDGTRPRGPWPLP